MNDSTNDIPEDALTHFPAQVRFDARIFKSIRRMRHAMLALLLLASGPVAAGALEKLFAPKPELWSRWSEHVAQDRRSIDHGAWDRFLKTYRVQSGDGTALVAYGRVSTQDRALLDAYLSSLSAVPVSSYSRTEQLAFWINLYNALTVRTVLDRYPVESIRDIDISPGLFADGPWGKKLIEVEGEPVSLNDIEHRILRPIWMDPRLHYALNCASIGCPDLQPAAFTTENTEALLGQAARDYINDARGVRFSGAALTLSSIYSWFEEDFARDGGVLPHLRRYADPPLATALERFDGVWNDDYDWSLNDADSVRR